MERAKRYFGKVCSKHPELDGERYVANRSCTACNLARYRQTYHTNADFRVRDAARHNRPKYRAQYNATKKKRYHADPGFALLSNLRCRMATLLKQTRKAASTFTLLGVPSMVFYRSYLEEQFQPGMTWENYGTVWHVDHRIPLATLDMRDPTNQQFLFNYKNTRPMLADANRRRSNNLVFEDLL